MDWLCADILVGACHFLFLCLTHQYLAFCHTATGLACSMAFCFQKNKTQNLFFTFHFNPVHIHLWHFAINAGTKLGNIKSYINPRPKFKNQGFYPARGIEFF